MPQLNNMEQFIVRVLVPATKLTWIALKPEKVDFFEFLIDV